jgi:hypothetical protein
MDEDLESLTREQLIAEARRQETLMRLKIMNLYVEPPSL